MSLRKKMKLSDSKFEFAGGVANWCRLGYELSDVNITTDVEFLVDSPKSLIIAPPHLLAALVAIVMPLKCKTTTTPKTTIKITPFL